MYFGSFYRHNVELLFILHIFSLQLRQHAIERVLGIGSSPNPSSGHLGKCPSCSRNSMMSTRQFVAVAPILTFAIAADIQSDPDRMNTMRIPYVVYVNQYKNDETQETISTRGLLQGRAVCSDSHWILFHRVPNFVRDDEVNLFDSYTQKKASPVRLAPKYVINGKFYIMQQYS